METMWNCLRIAVYMQDENGNGWHMFPIYGSLIQGNLEGHPALYMIIAVVLHIVVNDPRLSQWSTRIRHWPYVDDWVIQVPLDAACLLMKSVLEATQKYALPLQLPECAFHVPALADQTEEEWSEEVKQLSQTISYCPEGLILLGTEACKEQEIPLYPPRVPERLPEPALKRKDKALRLASATLEMLALATLAGGKQPGFAIARGIIAHSFDCDAGVLPCSTLLPHASIIDDAVENIVARIMDLGSEQLDADQKARIG